MGRVLGMGAHSVVRSAWDLETGEEWACKCMKVKDAFNGGNRREGEAKPRDLADIYQEIRLLNDVKHEGVARFREWFEDDGNVYVIIERVKGHELLKSLMETQAGHFSEDEARAVMLQLLEVIRHLHRKDVVHRDLKLENVVQSGSTVKVLDFGLATYYARGSLLTEPCGTLYYTAPEVLSSQKSGYGKECDLWSVGVMLFAMLCGRMPFFAMEQPEVHNLIIAGDYSLDTPAWAAVSAEAKDLVAQMLNVDPSKRITATAALDHPWSRRCPPVESS